MTCLAFLPFTDAAFAINPNWLLSQYIRDRWGAEQGFPRGQVLAITQTSDGYLWIGTEAGLVRFDGINFRLMKEETGGLTITGVLGLTPDNEGNLWIRSERFEGIFRYRDGVFDNPSTALPWGPTPVTAIARTSRGELLASQAERGTVTYRGKRFEKLAVTESLPRSPVLSLAQTRNGDIWLGTRDAGLFRLRGEKSLAIVNGIPDSKINYLLPDGEKAVWLGTDNGIAHWNGDAFTASGIPEPLNHFQTLAMMRDRDGNLWAGTDTRGLLRLNGQGVSFLSGNGQQPLDAVTTVFEDREGSVWLGGANGLQRLRDSAFVTFSAAEGMPSANNGPIYVDAKHRTWFAPADGGLSLLENGRVSRFTLAGLADDIIYSITGHTTPDRTELWLGRQRGGLTHLRFEKNAGTRGAVTAETFTSVNGLAQNSIYAVHRGVDGTLWAGTLSAGVTALRGGVFKTYTTADGLASDTVSSIAETGDGDTWFGTPKGLSVLSKGKWRRYTASNGLPSDNVNCLLAGSGGELWLGTAGGLALIRAGAVRSLAGSPVSLREPVLGLAEDRNGWLWIATSEHVIRVKRDKLLQGDPAAAEITEYGPADGLQSTEGVKRQRSVFTDPLGRIWFSLNRGISVVDPSRVERDRVPVIAHIQTVSADGAAISLQGSVRVPAGQRRIAFGYTGLGLAVPERVRFRYALDGYDSRWSEPVAVRETAYTNLSPGPYRFRVVASNGDGVWSDPEASLHFEILPSWWETIWFRLASILACGFALVAAYFYRLHQLTRALNVRFEERLAERSRIAQELHDTLLQGLLSASMQLHVAADALPAESPTKPRLKRVLELMGQVVEEGRNAVRGLRSSTNASLDLAQAFSRIQDELAVNGDVEFRVVVGGEPRPLHPLLRDESYRIGREALVNAFRHSHATSIEAEVNYSQDRLRMLISDNGCGIDPQVLRGGRDGHWGLSVMRERAERIGGKFHVRSSAAAGTEVELSVPGHLAYLNEDSEGGWRSILRTVWPKKKAIRNGED